MTDDSHPDLIAWVAGLDAHGARSGPLTGSGATGMDVAEHLRRCEACREEAAALRSMRRSLRASEEARLPIATLRRAGGARLRAGPRRPRAPAGAGRPAWAWAVAAGTGVVVLGWALWVGPLRRPGASTVPATDGAIVVFPAPSRGGSGMRTLPGGAPATVRAALPFGSAGGAYEARLERPDGAVVAVAGTRIVKDGEWIEVRLEVPDTPGEYRLRLVPEGGRGEPIVYPLRILAAAERPQPVR